MIKLGAMVFLFTVGAITVSGQSTPPGQNFLNRRYREGEKLTYHMKGINENWRYEIQADGIVKKDSQGFLEEYS